MPLALVCDIEDDASAWRRRPAALRALAYALFHRVDPALADALHSAEGLKPFTLAVLEDAEHGPRLRLTALDTPTERALRQIAEALAAGETVPFGAFGSVLTTGRVTLDNPPLAAQITSAQLAGVPFHARVTRRFLTPTAFSQGGDRHLPLPVPALLLAGWARRWNRFAPEHAFSDATLEGMTARVVLAEARIETATVLLQPDPAPTKPGVGPRPRGRERSGKMVGFTGVIALEALRPNAWPEPEQRAFAALTAYSVYCGTGAKTAQGLGLTLP